MSWMIMKKRMMRMVENLRPITQLEMKKGEPDSFEKRQLMQEALKEIYNDIQTILRDYVDTSEENYMIIALWIIGTYYHENFLTYPYLFFNAMRGSAKTRTLKLIKHLAKDGDMLASLSEAVLFRTKGSLCIDEFERIDNKDKNALRELLNTAYKKGGMVKRMRKRKSIDGEVQVVEEFDTFRPICMANISGMEEVLGDRCIPLVLEKSNNPLFTKKVEDFEWNPLFKKVRNELSSVVSVVYMGFQNIYMDWNKYIIYIYTTTHTHLTTDNYNSPYKPQIGISPQETEVPKFEQIPTFPQETEVFFNKINKIGVDGRHLELFLPLMLIAKDSGILNELLEVVSKIVSSKKIDEIIESKDVTLYQFVSQQTGEWVNVKDLTNLFRNYCGEEQTEDHWLNPRWMGKALKRLNLVGIKRRVGEGIQVVLNIEKAKLKMEIFK